ncbi:MAG: adenosine deaminase [Bdellovibrionaceae bacterium]|nr:adenosine deaminase [Pseudobdellovibrionaceae bacterium]MBX3033015.1 adenosine deaminase [Pseudobdellovibrionaceae bacterium]
MSFSHLTALRGLPKVDLHRHLDCSMRWSTLVELAPQVGIPLPASPSAWRDEFLVTSPMRDLDSVLKKFLHAQKVLSSEEILERLAFEACEDAWNDGILILELRYAPSFIADGHANLNFDRIHAALWRGIERARRSFPMAVGLIGIIQRIKSFETARTVADFVIDHRDSFLGLDLADNELGFDPKPFAPLFEKARRAGLRLTVHSGETPDDTAPKWVRDSIEVLGAERIGHGVQIIRDPQVLAFVRDRKIPLEVCPISNWLTRAFPDHQSHPIRRLIEAGVRVTINTDDPGIFDTTLTDDYEVLARVHGFTAADFNHANDIAAAASFIPRAERARVWPRPLPP